MLPALPLPAFDMGVLLLVSLAFTLFRPLSGVILHSLLLVYAMLSDQTRIQPEIVSLALLLWGALPSAGARTVGRAHLIALWSWAGINKLLSPAFLSSTGPMMFATLFRGVPGWLHASSGYLIACAELTTGLLAIFPRTRRLAALLAFGLHGGILLTLAARRWNEAVWPWNVAAALAGFALIYPWKSSLWASIRASRRAAGLVALIILFSPALWFVGMTDAYLAHHLYSEDVPRASSTALDPNAVWNSFNVPLPPEQRLFEQFFRLTCAPGDTMTIIDERWWYRAQGQERRMLECTR